MLFNPKVSIIIPVYNGSNYLREAIDSALAQTYENIEVIVINDGSTDKGKTEAIALSYGDKIRYFYKENGGVSSALNFGIKMSKGDYISWLSHDDAFLPQKIEEQIKYLQKEESKDNIILFSDYEIINERSEHVGTYKVPLTNPENIFVDLLAIWPVHGCTTLIPKACFDKVGLFDENNKTVQDYDMWFRFLKHGCRYRYFPMALTRFRVHEKQDSSQKRDSYYEERENTYLHSLRLFEEELGSLSDDETRRIIIGLRETKGLPKAAACVLRFTKRSLKLKIYIGYALRNIIDPIYKIMPGFIKAGLHYLRVSLPPKA